MKKTKVYSTLTIMILILSSINLLVPKVSASGPQHHIILPFSTSWEEVSKALGRTDSVDFKEDFSNPHLVYLNNEVAPLSHPFYDFGSRQLKASGSFDSSSSHCYFNLFDPTPNTDWGPPFRLKPHTFINIWYYHKLLADCMIDVELYNDNTGQWWNASDFNDGNGNYIVDQNGVRLHPAHRWNDTIGCWNFSSFDLSMIYEDDPENWFVSKIWVGFDNRIDGKTGQASTYFDLLYISYAVSDVRFHTADDDNAQTSGSIVAWHYTHPPSGKYDLYLKLTVSGFDDGHLRDGTGVIRVIRPYTLKVSTDFPDTHVRSKPEPTGRNLKDTNSSLPPSEVSVFIFDCVCTLVSVTSELQPIGLLPLALEFYGLLKLPVDEPTYEWPHVDWGEWNDRLDTCFHLNFTIL